MSSQEIEVFVVGAGQAGVAMSEHLRGARRAAPRPGAASYRRALALGAVGLAGRQRAGWHDRFPGWSLSMSGPRRFRAQGAVADYFGPTRRRSAHPSGAASR